MNSKLKDILLYSFAAIGVFSLFIAATNDSLKSYETTTSNFEMHKMENNKILVFNKNNGDIIYKEIEGDYAIEEVSVDVTGTLKLNSGFFKVYVD